MSRLYSVRAVISGDIIEVYDYVRPQARITGAIPSKGRSVQASSEEAKRENREQVLNRARRTVRRLVNSNTVSGQYGEGVTPKFLTLTFAENIQDIKQANYEWKKFLGRFATRYGYRLKYCAVVEFQDKNGRGAVHYHVMCFNMPYLDVNRLSKVWGKGFIKLNKIDHVNNVGSYMTKYMVKNLDDERLQGEKCYFASKRLKRDKTVLDIETITQMRSDNKEVYRNEFENQYTGKVVYTIYSKRRVEGKAEETVVFENNGQGSEGM